MSKKSFLKDEEFERLGTLQLLEIIKHGLLFERGRALYEIGRRSGEDKSLIELVANEIAEPKNKSSIMVGIASISFLGIAGLLEADTESTRQAAKDLIDRW